MIIGVVALVVVIFGFLVFVHELGHFLAARRNGVEVEEFGFGFPPRLYGKQVGRTFYSVNWLPLGGFVRLKGEDGADTSPGSFAAASFWVRTKILLAGVGMNALTAYILLLGLCVVGLPPLLDGQFSLGTPSYAQPPQVMAVEVGKGSPAEAAGITRGDFILSSGQEAFKNENDLTSFTKSHAGQPVELTVKHGGQDREVSVTLRGPDSKEGFLGVTPYTTYKLRYGWNAPVVALGLLLQLVWATLAAFGGLVAGLISHGQVSSEVTGPVGIVALLGNVLSLGLSYLLVFITSISVSLAVLNILPVPALDGGRWALMAIQKVTKKHLKPQIEANIHMIGFACLLLLMAVITYFDIRKLGR